MAMRASLLVWRLIDWTIGARITRGVEILGQDIAELGIEAFPEFLPQPEELIPPEAAPRQRGPRMGHAPRVRWRKRQPGRWRLANSTGDRRGRRV